MIDAWTAAPSGERLTDLWSHLCHQGTVYSASFEAIPLLAQACHSLDPKERRSAIMLMGAIWASDDRFDGAAPSETVAQLVPSLGQMVEKCLGDADVDAQEFPYLLQAAASFSGDLFWGRHLDHLAGGEFPGVCPTCEGELFIAIGRYGYFASAEDYIRNTTAKCNPVVPAPASMPPDGRWLYAHAVEHRQEETAKGIAHIFGATQCPTCEATISVVDAIRRWMGS